MNKEKKVAKPAVTRVEITRMVANKLPYLLEKDVELGVRNIFDFMISSLVQGRCVEIRGFGRFFLRHRPARKARNPKTEERLIAAPKNVIHFKPGTELREKVNGKNNNREKN